MLRKPLRARAGGCGVRSWRGSLAASRRSPGMAGVVPRTPNARTSRLLCFFFQAEDGIRDIGVTGVQTCALPISLAKRSAEAWTSLMAEALCGPRPRVSSSSRGGAARTAAKEPYLLMSAFASGLVSDRKSVVEGKSVDLGGRRIIKKKTQAVADAR